MMDKDMFSQEIFPQPTQRKLGKVSTTIPYSPQALLMQLQKTYEAELFRKAQCKKNPLNTTNQS